MPGGYIPNSTLTVIGDGPPLDSNFAAVPSDGQDYIDQVTGITYTRVKGNWVDAALSPASTSPTGWLAATDPSRTGTFTDNATGLTDGTLALVAIKLFAGQLVSNVNFVAGATTAVAPTHSWAVLASGPASAPVVLGVSADGTTAVPTTSAQLSEALVTPVRITTTGLYYIGLAFKVTTTLPSVITRTGTTILNTVPPIFAGTSNTGVTTPPAVNATLTTITPTSTSLYGGVS